MATITAVSGIKTAFLGGVDDIICNFSPAVEGVQVEAEGFTLNNATLQARGVMTSTYDTIALTDAVASAAVGQGMKIRSVRISAVAGGSYFVSFTPLKIL
jgi:hypothetical protein